MATPSSMQSLQCAPATQDLSVIWHNYLKNGLIDSKSLNQSLCVLLTNALIPRRSHPYEPDYWDNRCLCGLLHVYYVEKLSAKDELNCFRVEFAVYCNKQVFRRLK